MTETETETEAETDNESSRDTPSLRFSQPTVISYRRNERNTSSPAQESLANSIVDGSDFFNDGLD